MHTTHARFSQTQITLIALVSGPDARKFDTTAALVKVSEAHRISLLLAVEQGDLLSRFANYLVYAVQIANNKLEHGAPAGPKDPTVSRYGSSAVTAVAGVIDTDVFHNQRNLKLDR